MAIFSRRRINGHALEPTLRSRLSSGRRARPTQWLSVGLVTAAVGCLLASALLAFGSVPETRREAARDTALQRGLSQAEVLLSGLANDERGYLLSGDARFTTEFDASQRLLSGLLRTDAAPSSRDATKILTDDAVPAYQSYLADHADVMRLFAAGDKAGATAMALGHYRGDLDRAQAAVATALGRATAESAIETNREAGVSTDILVALLVLGVGLTAAAAEVARRMRQLHRAERARRDTEDQHRTLIDHIPAAVYTVDTAGIVESWNPAAAAMFGWSAEEAVGQMLPFVGPDQRDEFARLRGEILAGHDLIGFETVRRRKDGTAIDVSISTAAVFDEGGRAVGIIGITSEITERKRAAAELEVRRAADRRLAAIVDASADAILSASLDATVTTWNAGAEAMFGYRASEIIGRPLSTFISPADLPAQRLIMVELAAGRSVVGAEGTGLRKDGTEVPVSITAAPILDAHGAVIGVSGVLRDITAQNALQATLERRALHDDLTGLPNRVLFLDRLAFALGRLQRRPGTLAVLFIDLDRFKVINDNLGHDQGDRLLVAIGERLADAVRPGDTVARFGGDEFVVLCDELLDVTDAVAIADRIRDAVATPLVLDGHHFLASVSTGIALATSPRVRPADLVRDADSAMYAAKDAGRACTVVFTPSMRARAVHRYDTEIALRRAIVEGELRLHYQPIVNLRTGRVGGVESLVRWQHPTSGLLAPSDFIDVAEASGLILPLGEWVLGEACRQAQVWHAHPALAHLSVAVNLSARQVAQPDLAAVVANILAQTGLDPSSLVLEITESVLMRDTAQSLDMLASLKALGVRLSIDDFGTGYSSLSYLKRFPIDILKIDKSFVDGLGTDNSDAAIVAATVNLAQSLGLATVAEGTETALQVQTLTDLGCDNAQGYLFARPQPAATLTRQLTESARLPLN